MATRLREDTPLGAALDAVTHERDRRAAEREAVSAFCAEISQTDLA